MDKRLHFAGANARCLYSQWFCSMSTVKVLESYEQYALFNAPPRSFCLKLEVLLDYYHFGLTEETFRTQSPDLSGTKMRCIINRR
jgi:hypothetical protein